MGEVLCSRSPHSGEVIEVWPPMSDRDLEHALATAARAARDWARTSWSTRAAALRGCATLLRARQDALAHTITVEMGKPLREARAEVEKCAWVCEHYATHGPAMLASEPVAAKVPVNHVQCRPLGPILAIMPWNFPQWQLWRFAAPALMAGNGVLLKHAPNTMGCAEQIAAVVADAGLPAGLLTNLRLPVDRVAGVIADPRVRAVTLTGSDRAGRQVAATAGAHLKKCVLELGGNDPFIILDRADLDRAVAGAVAGRMLNAGQVCNSPKRIFVPRRHLRDVTDGIVDRLSQVVLGDPLADATTMGPLARPDLVVALQAQLDASVAQGARLVLGGQPMGGPSSHFLPTVLTDVPEACPAADDELFGPVLSLFVYDDVDEAILRANRSRYGLCASVWGDDPEQTRRVADQLDVGGVFVNQVPYSDPRLPFGGVRDSGHGRELGTAGIRELVALRTLSLG